MMQISNNGIITTIRGDYEIIPLHIFTNGEKSLTNNSYIPQANDKVFFAITEPNQRFEDAILKKVYCIKDLDSTTYNKSTGEFNIILDSADTEWLVPGDYYYQVKILKKDVFDDTQADGEGKPITVIPKTKFVIYD